MCQKLLKHFVALTIFLLSVSCLKVHAQQLTSEQIKTAYLYNFIKHVKWPDEEKKVEFTVAIFQDDALYQTFATALNDRVVKEKKIAVKLVENTGEASKADLVFISVSPAIDVSTIASDLRNTSTLLVTDNSIDKHNIMINLVFNPETLAISFEVNKSNIVFEQLEMSAELLLLGGTEIDVAQLYRATELAMQKMRIRETELNNVLEGQKEQLGVTGQRLNELNRQLKNRERTAEQSEIELVALKKNIEQQTVSIAVKEKQLSELALQLETTNADLEEKQSAAEAKEKENKAMANRIIANRNILSQQQSQLNQQGLQLNQKNEELAQRSERIEQQRFYLLVLAVFITIVLLISMLVVWLFIKNKQTTRKLSQTLTNLKSMQDQLIQSEKLASLGKLTAGVAHEINTPLGIALTSTSSALENTKEIKTSFEGNRLTKSAMTKYFESIETASELNMSSLNRVIELLNNFKQVAADQVVGEVREVDLVSYVAEIMQTLSAELKRFRVDYHYYGEDEVTISTIPGALAQVITNLVTNSIKHGFAQKNSGNISITLHKYQDSVVLVFADDGEGMNNEILQNIFEPFFTTKRNSGGTGLGMNIVHNIISQKLLGDIKIESEPQKGARFIITLPLAVST